MMEAHPTAVGTTVPLHLYEKGLLIRAVEQKLLQLFAEGKLFGTVHTCIGQEWTGVAVAEALRDGDCVFTNHRGHGHFLARTDDVDGLVAEIMGKQSGVCGGKGGSQHLCAEGFYSNGIQGGMMPVAAGVALAQKIRGRGMSVIFVGDGTLGEGALYEALNIASKWDLPLLVVLENNLYAQSTSQRQTLAGDILERPRAFGIRTEHADTWDPRGLVDRARALVEAVRAEGRPAFLRVDTYRLMAHSKGDDNRDKAEVDAHWARDPLAVFLDQHPEEGRRLKARVDERVARAVARAEASPFTAAEATDEEVPAEHPVRWSPAPPDPSDRMVNLIHAALQRAMRRDERVVLIGEDIEGPYGGAFKATKDLSLEMPGRVRNTPISESAIVGLGNGLALAGMRPVCEIMFGDFLTLCADQLVNHASKFRYMYDGKVEVPLVVRTPMGGKRGYGPTHSQSIEKHFLGLPGTRVVALHSRMDPGVVYDTIFATIDRPTLVVENKLLYAVRLGAPAPEGFVIERSDEVFPTTRIRPAVPADLTILCYGGTLPDAEKAAEQLFDEEEIVAEILCPTQLYPLDPWPIVESVRRTGRLLVVEEGHSFAAFGAEVVAQILESAPGAVRRVRRVASPRHPIPSSGPLEKALLPGPSHIVAAAKEIARA